MRSNSQTTFCCSHAGAIQTLLISDSLFRINDVAKRKRYVGLVDSVKDSGGEVRRRFKV